MALTEPMAPVLAAQFEGPYMPVLAPTRNGPLRGWRKIALAEALVGQIEFPGGQRVLTASLNRRPRAAGPWAVGTLRRNPRDLPHLRPNRSSCIGGSKFIGFAH